MYKGNQNYYKIVTSSFIAHSCYKNVVIVHLTFYKYNDFKKKNC